MPHGRSPAGTGSWAYLTYHLMPSEGVCCASHQNRLPMKASRLFRIENAEQIDQADCGSSRVTAFARTGCSRAVAVAHQGAPDRGEPQGALPPEATSRTRVNPRVVVWLTAAVSCFR